MQVVPWPPLGIMSVCTQASLRKCGLLVNGFGMDAIVIFLTLDRYHERLLTSCFLVPRRSLNAPELLHELNTCRKSLITQYKSWSHKDCIHLKQSRSHRLCSLHWVFKIQDLVLTYARYRVNSIQCVFKKIFAFLHLITTASSSGASINNNMWVVTLWRKSTWHDRLMTT